MKKLLLILLTVCAFQASAADIDASDPCTVTLCMYGMTTGTADSQCREAIKKFFSIRVVSLGVFMPWKTFSARNEFLAGCSSASPSSVSQIMNRYGTSQ